MPRKQTDNIWSWLGRQVGHVRKAIRTDVSGSGKNVPPGLQTPAAANPEKIVYRQDRIEEKPMPDDPTLKLRRTTIDEVIAEPREPTKPS